MTIHDIATQLYNLTFDGFVNGEKFTKRGLETAIRAWMRDVSGNKIPNTHVIEACLPDGRWLVTITKFADRPDGYDYSIPDTREEEARIWARLAN